MHAVRYLAGSVIGFGSTRGNVRVWLLGGMAS